MVSGATPGRCPWLPAALLLAAACTAERDPGAYFAPADETLTRHALPSFEEFRERTRVKGQTRELYLVEGDFPITSVGELRAFYDQRVVARLPKSAVKLTPTVG